MVKVVIVEDNQSDEDQLRDHLSRYGRENGESFFITAYKSALDFLSAYKGDADMIFMDIELPDINGMDAARRLRKSDERVVLIFVTNIAQYAIEGYSVSAQDYLLKPVHYNGFSMKIKKALKVVKRYSDEFFVLSSGGVKVKLRIGDIRYVEVRAHRLIYHTDEGDFEVTGVLSKVEEKLIPFGFFRCNYCYLVNMNRVESVDKDSVMAGGDSLQISRSRKKDFLKALADYYGG